MFLAHSTALKSRRAASSQMFSMPMMLFVVVGGPPHCPVLPGVLPGYRLDGYDELDGYGSARSNIDTKLDR